MLSLVQHATLPAIPMSTLVTSNAFAMCGNAVHILNEDYIHVTQLRGLHKTRIAT